MTRYHHRFDSNVWVWPKYGKLLDHTLFPIPSNRFNRSEVDTTDTADPWIVVYADTRGGVSAATWVLDDSDNGIYAFYNTRIIDNYDGMAHRSGLSKLMEPIEGVPFSPLQKTIAEVWEELTTVVSPTYETYDKLKSQSKGMSVLLYRAMHFIPNSINKLHIGG